MDQALISIIIPVYNTEQYINRCLESLRQQSYPFLEMIVVDDCSSGNIKEITASHIKADTRIRIVSHERNKGLFQARLTGASMAQGDYIAFVDSDDYVTIDFYRTLVAKARAEQADIVIGQTIFQNTDGEKHVKNFHDSILSFGALEGESIKEAYFSQQGQCFSWHTIWNKLYKKTLWDQCLPYYGRLAGHVIMTEDIAFSTPLIYFAKKIATTLNDGYCYCANENASTNTEKITIKRFLKNVSDMKQTFDFVDDFLKRVNAKSIYQKNFSAFRKHYSRIWRSLAISDFYGLNLTTALRAMDDFLPEYCESSTEDDQFFSSVTTPWNEGMEDMKIKILKTDATYISFDIFDTLIYRPLYNPDDLFILMDKKFEEIHPTGSIPFHKLRVMAEEKSRRLLWLNNPALQDVTLEEIYRELTQHFHIPAEIAAQLMDEENRLEIALCRQRKAAKELFDLAIACGKNVILVSDMYLDEEIIQTILKRCGYQGFEKLYLSSRHRLTKHTGDLFRFVIKDLGVNGKDIIHIGDTWESDRNNAEKAGIQTMFFPKAKEVFENKIQTALTGDCFEPAIKACGAIINPNSLHKSAGLRTMLALIANRYFDNPYRSFNSCSRFNADPHYIGYYALGMHVLGLIAWIDREVKNRNRKEVVFFARDGYLPMEAFKIWREKRLCSAGASYVHISRRAILPAMLEHPADFFDLPVERSNHTPESILELLAFCWDNHHGEGFAGKLSRDGISLEKQFRNHQEYNAFIRYFIENLYNQNNHRESLQAARQYLKSIAPEISIAFDIGYSGRIQAAVCRLLDKPLDVLFLHADESQSFLSSRRAGFSIVNFYDFRPCITGLIREHIFSRIGGSCLSYQTEAGLPRAVLGEDNRTPQDAYVVTAMQKGALLFMNDFLETFSEYIAYLPFKSHEVSLPFEGYLRHTTEIDSKVFLASYFEDMVYGARHNLNIYHFLRSEKTRVLYNHPHSSAANGANLLEAALMARGRLTKAAVYFLCDRTLFTQKLKEKLKSHPRLFRLCRGVYRVFKRNRSIK